VSTNIATDAEIRSVCLELSAEKRAASSADARLNLVEMTAHIRRRIKAAGIKARVRKLDDGCIQVFAPEYGVTFSDDQQREIRHIADCNRLTLVRGLPIVVEQMTNPETFNFYYTR